jgi:Domain of unknown function (DUF4412)
LKFRFVGAIFLFLTLIAFAQVPQLSPFSADLHITTSRANAPQDITGQVFVGSGHIRMNIDVGGHKTSLITDFATKTTDILLPEQQMYIEHKAGQPGRGPDSMTQDLKPYDPDHPCANQPDLTCKKIGTEEVSGRTCDHWQVTDKNGKVSDLWIDQKLHFPVQVISSDSTMLLTNIKEGQPEAGTFDIPPGFHKMDFGGMMPQGTQHSPQN